MPPELGSWVSWAEVNNGKSSTLAEFRNRLSRYSRSKVLYLCAVLNSLLGTWDAQERNIEVHAELLRYAFPPEYAERLIEASRHPASRRIVFHRQQLLMVAKEAILICQEQQVDPLLLPFWGGLAVVFLMASDHLHSYHPQTTSEEEELIRILPDLVLCQEYAGTNRLAHRAVRSHLMYTRLAAALTGHPEFLDLAQMFQKLTGLTLVEYEALCFGTLSKCMKLNLAEFKANPALFLLSSNSFHNAAVPKEKVGLFLSEVSATAEEFYSDLERKNTSPVDFTAFRNRPFIRQGDALYPIDPAFVGDKIETGPFWRVFADLPDDRSKKRLHAFWGALFEEYLKWLFSGSVDGRLNVYNHSPKYISDGNQVCDGIMNCGSAALFMEYKGSTFTAEAKYGGNGDTLLKEIKKKLVSAEKEKKGVTQLASAIQRVFSRVDPETVEAIDLRSVRTIFPVLVTRDEIGDTMLVNRFLNDEFQRVLDKRSVRPRRVTPLFCLTADEVEYISAYLRTVRFSDILQERYDADNSLQTPLQFRDLPSLAENLRNDLLKREFKDFTNGIAKVLFPNAPPLEHQWA